MTKQLLNLKIRSETDFKGTSGLRIYIVALVTVLLVVLMTGCGGSKEIIVGDEPVTSKASSPNIDQQAEASETLKVAVLVRTSATDTIKEWEPILDYIGQETGHQFEVIPTLNRDMFQTIEQGEVDFVTTNPLSSVQLKRLYGLQFLATRLNKVEKSNFGGVIFVRQDSGIKSLEELRGKRGMSMKFHIAAGGYAYQSHLLDQNGIDPHTDFAEFVEAKTQNDIVLAVANGTTDVGFVRTGQLEKLDKEGKIDRDDFLILHQVDDDHPYAHSTPLYPEWPFAALDHVDPTLVQQVREALFKLSEDHPSITTPRTIGFVEPLDYAPIDQLIEALQLPTWDAS